MANRLTKITTRTGDKGTTGLGDGARVLKSALRVAVIGDIDELNSMMGLLLTEPLPEGARSTLTRIQNELFDLGGEVCIPGHTALTDAHVLFLDGEISFSDIPLTIGAVLNETKAEHPESIKRVLSLDGEAREAARKLVKHRSNLTAKVLVR